MNVLLLCGNIPSQSGEPAGIPLSRAVKAPTSLPELLNPNIPQIGKPLFRIHEVRIF